MLTLTRIKKVLWLPILLALPLSVSLAGSAEAEVTVAPEAAVQLSPAATEALSVLLPVPQALHGCTWGNATSGDYGWAHCSQYTPGGDRYYRAKTYFEKWHWSCWCDKFIVRYGDWKLRPNISYAWGPGNGWNALDTYIQKKS